MKTEAARGGAGKNTEWGLAPSTHHRLARDEAGSDLGEIRDLSIRQLDEVEGAQFDAEASAPARDNHGLVVPGTPSR